MEFVETIYQKESGCAGLLNARVDLNIVFDKSVLEYFTNYIKDDISELVNIKYDIIKSSIMINNIIVININDSNICSFKLNYEDASNVSELKNKKDKTTNDVLDYWEETFERDIKEIAKKYNRFIPILKVVSEFGKEIESNKNRSIKALNKLIEVDEKLQEYEESETVKNKTSWNKIKSINNENIYNLSNEDKAILIFKLLSENDSAKRFLNIEVNSIRFVLRNIINRLVDILHDVN